MRRSICSMDPSRATAGVENTWKFSYTTAQELPKGAILRFDLSSKGRKIDWQIPQTDPKVKENLIWGVLPNGKGLPGKQLENLAQFDFVLPMAIKIGETFTIAIGTPGKKKGGGNLSQLYTQRRREFYLFIDPKGKKNFGEPEIFHTDVQGNALTLMRIITPSYVCRNRRFDVIVRFEDKYGNLTNNAPDGTMVDLSYENLRENLSWKLFVPETGFVTLPNLYFNEAGIYKIRLKNMSTNEVFISPPIKCFGEDAGSLYWGLLHAESDKIESQDNMEGVLRYFRDSQALQFFASSPFDDEEETPANAWKQISQHITEFNENERFCCFPGFQWLGVDKEEGLRQFIYLKEGKHILRKKDIKNNSLKKIYKILTPKEALVIPMLTMAKNYSFDFKDYNPDFERVVEIYNSFGSSECTASEGNERPISGKKKGISESADGSIRKALANGCRFGFIAGGLDRRYIYGVADPSVQTLYSPGLTGIVAAEQTREALIEALRCRSCFATTGERMLIGITIAGAVMGKELDATAKPGLSFNRHIIMFASGTKPLKKVELIRNGKVMKTFNPNNSDFGLAFDDTELLEKVSLPAKDNKLPFTYYYLKAVQEDGHIAWSSPIWIDCQEPKAKTSLFKKLKK